MRHLLPLCLFCWLSLAATAQDHCHLSAQLTVLDPDGATVPAAVVEVLESGKMFQTDINGRLTLDSLCDRTYSLKVLAVGYEVRKMEVRGGERKNIRLQTGSRNLTEAEVVAKRIEAESTVKADTLTMEQMERSKGQTLTDYLKNVAGVTSMQTGASVMKPVIHGMHSQRVLIMNAGVRQEGQQWGSEHAPEVDPFIAQKLTVVKGTSAIRYGADAIGGVIIVEPRELPHEPGINAEVNLVGMSNGRAGVASGLIEQHLGKFHDICWRIQGTARKSGNISTPEVYLQNTGFEEYNWSGSVGLDRDHWGIDIFYSRFFTRLGIFSGSHIGNLSDLRRIIESGETLTDDQFSYTIGKPRQEVTHQLLSVKAFLHLNGVGILRAQYGYQYNHRFEYDRDKPYNDSLAALNRPELELRLYTHTADLLLETKNFHGYTFTAGISALLQDNQYGGARFFVPNYVLYNGGAYGIIRKRQNRFETEAGFRFDYRSETVYRNVNGVVVESPYSFRIPNVSVGSLYKADSSLTLRFNAGTARRAPSINEWFSNGLHHGTATFESGDPSLGVEKAINAAAGLQFQHKRFSFDVSVFGMLINDYIYLVPDSAEVLTISGAYPSFRYRHVDAMFTGTDITFDWDIWKHVNLKSRNSLVFAKNRTANRYLELVPAPRFNEMISYTFRSSEHWKDLTAGITVLHVMKQWRYEDGSDYVPPPAAYTLFGLEWSGVYEWGGQQIRLGLSVSNLFNTRYRDYLNRLRYYSDEAGTNVILRVTVPMRFKTAAHTHQHSTIKP